MEGRTNGSCLRLVLKQRLLSTPYLQIPGATIYLTVWASDELSTHMGQTETAGELYGKHAGEPIARTWSIFRRFLPLGICVFLSSSLFSGTPEVKPPPAAAASFMIVVSWPGSLLVPPSDPERVEALGRLEPHEVHAWRPPPSPGIPEQPDLLQSGLLLHTLMSCAPGGPC